MKYRRIPFVSPGATLNGLKRARRRSSLKGYGPQYPNSSFLGAASLSRFFGEESAINDNGIVNDRDAGMFTAASSMMPYAMPLGSLGAATPTGQSTTVMLRPQPGAPPGFPGFFAWLK